MAGCHSLETSRVHTAISGPDGRYELPVPPGAGHLLVLGPTPDYVPVETSTGVLEGGKPGAGASMPTRSSPWKRVRRGARKPSTSGCAAASRCAAVSSVPTTSPPARSSWSQRSFRVSGYKLGYNPDVLRCTAGQFELPGCDPDRPNIVYLLDPEHRLGATVRLTRESATAPATVRLRPCGSARAQLVDADGKPLAKYRPWFSYLLAEGEPPRIYMGDFDYALEAD